MLKNIIFKTVRFSGLPWLIRNTIQKQRVTVILFHNTQPELFEKHIQCLQKRFNIISLQQYLKAYYNNSIKTLPPKSLVITFDDGHVGNYKLLPVLKKYGVPVTIFLCSSIINTNRHYWFREAAKHRLDQEKLKVMPDDERLQKLSEIQFTEEKEYSQRQALNADEISEMKQAVDFQSHTNFHVILPFCSDDKAQKEIFESKTDLEKEHDLSINTISYPNGDYSDRDINFAKQAGYVCGITVDCGFNSEKTDMFKIKRMNINDDATIDEVIVKASALWDKIRVMFKGQDYGFRKI